MVIYDYYVHGKEQPSSPFADKGVLLESHAVARAEAELGILFNATGDSQKRYFKDRVEDLGYKLCATPDGNVVLPGGDAIGLEVKTWQKMNPCEEVPYEHQIQVCGQIEICGFDFVYYAAFEYEKQEIRIWKCLPCPDLWKAVLGYLDAFAIHCFEEKRPKRFTSKARPKLPTIPMETERIL